MARSLLLFIFLMVGAGGALAAGALRVGLSPDYPPLAYKQDGRVVGIEADNARAVGEILARPITLVELPFKQLIPALNAGRIDVIMSGLSVTADRSKQVTFTDAYMRVGQMAILLKDKVARFAQPWSIYREGVRVGVEPGTTGDAFAQRELKDAKISYYENSDAAFEGLRRDEIDLYVHDAPTSWQLAQSMENDDLISLYAPLTEEMLAWAVRPEDAALAAELNQALALMKSNGTLQYILNRWIPVKIEVR
ncbi:MAG: transporter substrate-binding domain-containing protein [Halioglobus sp.]|jgi:ABC-type amino acid transport substrate-binding protein